MRAIIISLALLTTHLPAYAEEWDPTTGWYEQPDDMVCAVRIDEHKVVFTYRSGFEPKVMPVEGMVCHKRLYEEEADDFSKNTDLFYEQYPNGYIEDQPVLPKEDRK